jgi:DNA mismatch repair ATPase MutL
MSGRTRYPGTHHAASGPAPPPPLPHAAAITPLAASLAGQLHAVLQIPDVTTAVFELVSNSLDSGARHVCVELLALGPSDLAFSVEDDGYGVAPTSFASLALPGHTSKLSSADMLNAGPETMGFKVYWCYGPCPLACV